MDVWETLAKWFHQVWYLQLYSSGNDIVRLNQLVIACVVIGVGVILSKKAARAFAAQLQKMDLDGNTAYTLQRLFAYFLFAVVALIALPIAGIPITVLTVLGGAFAIGIGFGAQNLFNNLISGIILMLERPIRIGDIVELEDEKGRIEDIGNRCVRVRRNDGVDVLIPNSYFIQQSVINWTLHDRDVRGKVSVGVQYGSPTNKVHDLMLSIATEQPDIHKSPAPFVLFENFGNSALEFSLYFWTQVNSPMDLKEKESTLRYKLDALFRQHGIVVAYPQSDIHLDAGKPLAVELVNPH